MSQYFSIKVVDEDAIYVLLPVDAMNLLNSVRERERERERARERDESKNIAKDSLFSAGQN